MNTICRACNGTGKKTCFCCDGEGKIKEDNLSFVPIWGIPLTQFKTCQNCKGTGIEKCVRCRGTGKIIYEKKSL